jgi:hypothetical protein
VLRLVQRRETAERPAVGVVQREARDGLIGVASELTAEGGHVHVRRSLAPFGRERSEGRKKRKKGRRKGDQKSRFISRGHAVAGTHRGKGVSKGPKQGSASQMVAPTGVDPVTSRFSEAENPQDDEDSDFK